jgi:hypothetical protein
LKRQQLRSSSKPPPPTSSAHCRCSHNLPFSCEAESDTCCARSLTTQTGSPFDYHSTRHRLHKHVGWHWLHHPWLTDWAANVPSSLMQLTSHRQQLCASPATMCIRRSCNTTDSLHWLDGNRLAGYVGSHLAGWLHHPLLMDWAANSRQ